MKSKLIAALLLISTLSWLGCVHQDKTTQTTSTPARQVSSVEDLTAPWAFDPGPEDTEMGRELVNIVATQPYMPGISLEMTGDQKFRPAFGPTLWRMIQKPNSIKILFIGQDGTHIAEAAGRTATAGFGGRAQDMAAHFGVENSAAFMNAFAYTIQGQYGGFGAPVVSEVDGKRRVDYATVVENGMWLMAQDQNSPMVKWRNKLIDWIIRNNRDSLKMVVLFGGPAQDSIGTFIEHAGGQVGTRFTADDIAARKIKVPIFKLESAGGNKVVPVALTKDGKNIFNELGVSVPYRDLGLQERGTPEQKEQIRAKIKAAEAKLNEAKKALSSNIDKVYSDLAIANAGLNKSGLVHEAQIDGYDLAKITVNGKKTISMKGLKLSDGTTIDEDIVIAEFPHPTSLSSNMATASEKVEKSLTVLRANMPKGWDIPADPGRSSRFTKNEPYNYGRADIGPAFYDFGTPKNRMVSVSSAYRMSGKPNIVVIGTREKATFDEARIAAVTKATPPAGSISNQELFSARPRDPKMRFVYDRGPDAEIAKIMKENIDIPLIGKMKNGQQANPKCADPEPASQFNIKSHPLCVGDFGHYRGTFDQPKVLILADPDGFDDILTSRALTGTRGQFLHGLMEDMGVKDKYLVIKTVPFGMDGATDAEWKTVLEQTAAYREKVLGEILKRGGVELVLADGKYAAQEITKLRLNVNRVVINRNGTENNSGIKEAAAEIAKIKTFGSFTAKLQMANIPRSHLGFFSRVWEGTSGTRVLDAASAGEKGTAFAIIVPAWVFQQKQVVQSQEERNGVETLKGTIEKEGLPKENEKFLDYLKRGGGRDSYFRYLLKFDYSA